MFKKISYMLKSLDIYGGKFEMNLGKKRGSFKTIFGSLLTLMFVTLVILSIYIFVSKYIDTSNPQITVSSEVAADYPQMDLYSERILVGFIFFNGTGFVNADNVARYATFTGVVSRMTINGSAQNPVIEKSPIIYEPCKNANKESGILDSAFTATNSSHLFLEVTLCPNHDSLKKWVIEGNIATPPFSMVNLMVYPCSLPDKNQCASLKELAVSSIYSPQMSKSVDYADKMDPVKSSINTNTELLINPLIMSKQLLYYQRNRIVDDNYDFRQPELTHEFVNLDEIISSSGIRDGGIYCSPEKLASGECQPYLHLQLKSGNKITTVHRKYEKIFATISELGGFGDLIYIIFAFFYMFYNHYYYKRWMRNQLMFTEEKKLKKYVKNLDKKELENSMEDLVEENTNGLVLMERMGKLKVLFEFIFEESHHKLLPLLLVEMSKEEAERKKEQEIIDDKIGLRRQDTIFNNKISLKKAYENLKKFEPNNEIQERINEMFLKKLEKYFENKIESSKEDIIAKYKKIGRKDLQKRVMSLREVPDNPSIINKKKMFGGKGIFKKKKNKIKLNNQKKSYKKIHPKIESSEDLVIKGQKKKNLFEIAEGKFEEED